jgi:hypothetical protein
MCKMERTEGHKISTSEINKKFWEELIAYFPLIRHGPQRLLLDNYSSIVVCVFVAAVTISLPSRCLATIGKIHIDTQTDGRY